MRIWRRGVPTVRLAAVAAASALMVTACGGGEGYVPSGMVRTPAPDVSEVVLPDVTNGGELAFRAEPGGLLIAYWGYTACPDICPTTMADLRKALRGLDDLAESVDVAMVTVDPDRDTPEVLTAYVQTFVPEGVAVRTEDADALAAAAEAFGVTYEVTLQDDGWVDVGHTAFLYAIDDDGRIRLTWPFGTDADNIESDMKALLEGRVLSNA